MFHLQPGVKNASDFIGRNRRAAGKAGGRYRQTRDDKKQQKKGASDTVEISKSELERLLKMAVSFQQTSPTHNRPDPSQIPGLQNHVPGVPGLQNQVPGLQNQVPGLQNHVPGLHNRFQNEVAEFQSNGIKKNERKTDSEQFEEYFPWGRPGGGAPIKTVSGTLLTNYCTRGNKISQQPSIGSFSNPSAQKQHLANSSPQKHQNHSPQHQNVTPSPQKSQFARGYGPHVDTFVLSQREEQRRKEQIHKAELAAQIAERQRQKEAGKRRKEEEELEAERKVRRELEEMNRRNEREKELRQQKAEEARLLQAELQASIQEAEAAAVRQKQRVAQQVSGPTPASTYSALETHIPKPSRIPLPSYHTTPQRYFPQNPNLGFPNSNSYNTNAWRSPPLPAVAVETTIYTRQARPVSPVVPALAKKLGLPTADHQLHVSPPKPSSPPQRHKQTTSSLYVQSPHTHPSPSTLPPHNHQATLPSIPAAPQHTGTPFPSHHSHNLARQQQILNQLAVLREGILSQKKSVEQRMKLHKRRL